MRQYHDGVKMQYVYANISLTDPHHQSNNKIIHMASDDIFYYLRWQIKNKMQVKEQN